MANPFACPLCGEFRLGPVLPVSGRLLCFECALVYRKARGFARLRLWVRTMLRGKRIYRPLECD